MTQTGNRHVVRNVLILMTTAGVAVALRNALADKGGSYDPADTDNRR